MLLNDGKNKNTLINEERPMIPYIGALSWRRQYCLHELTRNVAKHRYILNTHKESSMKY